MRKYLSIVLIVSFMAINMVYVSPSFGADPVTQNISSETVARNIAAQAGGSFVEGASAPTLTGSQVALSVIDEATGNVIGHIVADQAALVTALNEAGLTEVASALAATQVGTAAGVLAGTGISLGTAGAVGAVAAVITIALVISGGDGVTTTHHH